MVKSGFEVLRLQYRESTTWTMYFLGLTLTTILTSISMSLTNPELSTTLLNLSFYLGAVSVMAFIMKEYRYYQSLGYLKKHKL